jgi:phosphatidate cytidylyltransferase
MTNTMKRILTGSVMAGVAAGVAALEYFGIHGVRWVAVLVALIMTIEFFMATMGKGAKKQKGKLPFVLLSLCPFVLLVASAYFVGAKPWIILLLLIIIAAADIGAWFFGRIIGGDKMWVSLSPNKTWSGQIAGIVCGTLAAVLYGLLGTDTFMPQLMWIGISVALLSQYGDLFASSIKRKLGIKDFGNILPGHGGFLDRFDGWIFVLPVVWVVMI